MDLALSNIFWKYWAKVILHGLFVCACVFPEDFFRIWDMYIYLVNLREGDLVCSVSPV